MGQIEDPPETRTRNRTCQPARFCRHRPDDLSAPQAKQYVTEPGTQQKKKKKPVWMVKEHVETDKGGCRSTEVRGKTTHPGSRHANDCCARRARHPCIGFGLRVWIPCQSQYRGGERDERGDHSHGAILDASSSLGPGSICTHPYHFLLMFRHAKRRFRRGLWCCARRPVTGEQ